MTWRWRWRKKKLAPKVEWQHEAAEIRTLLEAKPGNKFLECLLYLRLGYKPEQVAEMAKVPVPEVYRNIRNYKKGMPKAKPVKEKPKPLVFRFPEITGKQGTDFFLKREYSKEKRPWQVLFLIYLKTRLYPRDHEVALAEVAKEMGMKQADVLVILKAYLDGELHEREREPSRRPANRQASDETGVGNFGGLPLHLRDVVKLRRGEGHTEEEK